MKNKTLAAALLLAALFAAMIFAWRLPLIGRAGPETVVRIPKEFQSTREIAFFLSKEGVLRHPRLFARIMQGAGWDKKIQKGVYSFRQPESWPVLIRKLTRGETYSIKITIPEGWRAFQIAERLEAAGITNAAAFVKAVESRNLEGYLFPSTYHLEPFMETEEAVRVLYDSFRKVWQENFEGKPAPLNLTPKQVVTLASIVEREATLREEMPTIASVYLNRLRKRWRLEADPTVQYALGYWKKRILYKDLEVNSPYNTYRRFELPPGPICSPGKEAIAAVLNPASTPYLYFVAAGDGSHSFFQKLSDHNRAKEKMIKERRQKNKK